MGLALREMTLGPKVGKAMLGASYGLASLASIYGRLAAFLPIRETTTDLSKGRSTKSCHPILRMPE